MKLDYFIIAHKKIRWIKDLNVRLNIIKGVEEKPGMMLLEFLSNIFLNLSPQARPKKKEKEMGLHQTKKLLHSEGNHQQNKKVTYGIEENI